jgi:uncharacterized protein
VHQWDGSPESDWYPWAKEELEKMGYQVLVPEMPTPHAPEIKTWVAKLKVVVGAPDTETVLMGHSVGCQTILRFLETLSDNEKVGKVIMVAPWFRLTATSTVTEEEKDIASPWLKTPINFEKAKEHCDEFIAIFSDDDYFVPLEFNKKVCEEKLSARVIILNKMGHFSEGDGVTELPILLKVI